MVRNRDRHGRPGSYQVALIDTTPTSITEAVVGQEQPLDPRLVFTFKVLDVPMARLAVLSACIRGRALPTRLFK